MAKAYKYQGIKCYKCNNEAPGCSCRALNWSWAGYPMQLQEKWQGTYTKRNKYFSKKVRREAMNYYKDGYRQVSRRYNMIQRQGLVTNLHGATYMGKVGESVNVSEDVLNCIRRIGRTVHHYKYYIKAREEHKAKAERKIKRDKNLNLAEQLVIINPDKAREILESVLAEASGHPKAIRLLNQINSQVLYEL